MVNEVPAFSRSRTRGSTIRRDRGDEARVPLAIIGPFEASSPETSDFFGAPATKIKVWSPQLDEATEVAAL